MKVFILGERQREEDLIVCEQQWIYGKNVP